MRIYFKRLYCLAFKDVIKMKVDDSTYKNIFIHDRPNNADKFNYAFLGNGCYLRTPKIVTS